MSVYRNIFAAMTAIGATALLLPGCGKGGKGQNQMPPTEVTVIEVQAEKTSIATELPGRIAPRLIAEVRPQVGGIIQKRLFEEGTDVKAGEVLYQIDPSLYQAAFDKATADLIRAEANVVPLRNKSTRYRALLKVKAVSQQSCDDVVGEYNKANAEIAIAKAAKETARINLEYTRITAPISGRIGKSNVTVGALVTANHLVALATIQQIDPVYVDVTQSSNNILRLKNDMSKGLLKSDDVAKAKVKVFFDDGTLYPLEGVLQFRDVTVDQSTGSLTLRMIFPNPDHLLLPGMFVRAVVNEGVVEQAIMIPQQTVMRDIKGNPYALVVNKSDIVERRDLVVARTIGNKWMVSSGLAPGDRIIMEGLLKVRPGMPVKVRSFEEAAQPQQKQSQQPANAASPKTAKTAESK